MVNKNLETESPNGKLPEENTAEDNVAGEDLADVNLTPADVNHDDLPPLPDDDLNRTYILVARFTEKIHHHRDPEGNPDSKIWIVQAGSNVRTKTGRFWSVWIEPAYYEEQRRIASRLVTWIRDFDLYRTSIGFCNGRPMTSLQARLPLCVAPARPRTLYRVVHDQHPYGGICARGYKTVKTNPLTFQVHFQKHLKWACRELSPFMSTTDDIDKAMRICAMYWRTHRTGIEILTIDTTGADWDEVRMFDVQELLKCLDLPILGKNKYFENEFLIENEIPASAVVRKSLSDFKSQCSEKHRGRMEHWLERLENASGNKRERCEEDEIALPRKKSLWTLRFSKVPH